MLLFLIIALLACWLVYTHPWFQVRGLSSKTMLLSFVLKCLMGFALLWLYGHYLEIDRSDADVYKYFDDAVTLQSSVKESSELFWQIFSGGQSVEAHSYFEAMSNWSRPVNYLHINDNRTVIRLHSLLLFLSQGDIRVHQLFFSLFSFLGLVFLFKGMRRLADIPAWTFVLICLLPPSLLFWASGLLKETLVMLPLGLTVYGLALIDGKELKGWWLILLGVLGFYFIKPYVGICFLPSLLYLIITSSQKGRPVLLFCVSIVLLATALWSVQGFTSFNPIGRLSEKQIEFLRFASNEGAGSLIELQAFSDMKSFLLQSPQAIFNTLCRPTLLEVRSGLDALSALENAGYLLCVALCLAYRKRNLNLRLILFSLLFVICLALIVGSITPVLGAIVRYKAPLLPFVIFAMLLFVDFQRIPILRTRIPS